MDYVDLKKRRVNLNIYINFSTLQVSAGNIGISSTQDSIFRPGWGGCRVATGGVNPNTSNLVAMITSKEGGYKALHFQSCSNDYKCERMV